VSKRASEIIGEYVLYIIYVHAIEDNKGSHTSLFAAEETEHH
jgi:hypothetical protein